MSYGQTTLNSEDFNSDYGTWEDGGDNCTRRNNSDLNNTYVVELKNGTNSSLTTLSNNINLTTYNSASFQFDFRTDSMEPSDHFEIQFSSNGGSSWETIKTYVRGTDFNNDTNYTSQIIYISNSSYSFSANSKFRIRNYGNNGNDRIYIDNIEIIGHEYCTSSAYDAYGNYNDDIRLVNFNSINNPTPNYQSGYSDFTNISTDVTINSSYDLSVYINTAAERGNWRYHVWAWIDWNQDGDFDDNQEAYDLGDIRNELYDQPSLSPKTITIPSFAVIGSTRMRVTSRYNNNPSSCDNNFDGEVEDYTINVIPSVSGFSEVIASVDWPLYSTENRVEIYSPLGVLITTIDNGFDSSVPNPDVPYSTTVNLGCLENASNYYVIMYDRGAGVNGPGDGWDRNLPSTLSNITITSGGTTVLSNDGWTARSGGVRVDFDVSGGGVCDDPEAPGGVSSNLNLWLKADIDVLNGGSDASNGDVVDNWNDQTTNANNASKAGSSNNAIYAETHHNFNPSVNFINGDQGYFDVNLDGIKNSNYNLIAIVERSTLNNDRNYFLGTANSSSNRGLHFGYRNNTSATLAQYANDIDVTVNSYDNPNQSVALLRGQLNTSSGKIIYELRDGTSVSNSHGNTAELTGTGQGVLGRGYTSTGFEGYVSEVIAYNRTLSDAELQQIFTYLAVKYGMTLDKGTNGNYTSSNATLLWDATANDVYHNNVTGIGRDDNSVLNQKQSKSENASNLGDASDDITIGLGSIETTNNLNLHTFSTDESFLLWGHNNSGISAGTPLTDDLSTDISGIITNVAVTPIERVWKVVETGTVETTKISIPETMLSAVSGVSGDYFMLVSNSETFDASSTAVKLILNGSNLETDFDFTGEQFITFGYAPYTVVEERALKLNDIGGAASTKKYYVNMGDVLNLNTSAYTISVWIKGDAAFDATTILSKRDNPYTQGYELKKSGTGSGSKINFEYYYSSTNKLQLISTNVIPVGTWHHIAIIHDGSNVSMYIDGVLENSESTSGKAIVSTNDDFLIGAAGTTTPNSDSYFPGSVDELRIWNVALSTEQLRYIMNQEIESHSDGTVTGVLIPQDLDKNEVNTLNWATDLAAYYPMSTYAYPNLLIDDSENENHGVLMNGMKSVDVQTAPLPYASVTAGNWDTKSTWSTSTVQYVPNSTSLDGTEIDWNIVKLTNTGSVTSGRGDGNGITLLGLLSEVDSNLTMDGETDPGIDLDVNPDQGTGTGTGESLTISHYLKLDGTIDLEGESQLIQTENSTLNVGALGVLERDQQGTASNFSYNYWGSPVGVTKVSGDDLINDFSYSLGDVLYDGSNKVTFTSNLDANPGSTLTISTRWLYIYTNANGDYAKWSHIGNSGSVKAGEGFTMKGSGNYNGNLEHFQNYTFKGKPNNGTITLSPLSSNNIYLVANPYPSSIDAEKFVDENGETVLKDGALYYWEQYESTSHVLAQYQGGYAVWTKGGSVPAAIPDGIANSGGTVPTDAKIPKRYIPVAQGFFVKSADESSDVAIKFNNSQRIFAKESHIDNMGEVVSTFMKSSSTKENSSEESNFNNNRVKIRLGFEASQVGHRQLLLTIDEKATDSVDWGYDAQMLGVLEDDMFWDLADEKYIIQATNSIADDKEIPLGIVMGESGLAIIKVDDLENIDENVELYIKDKNTLRFYKINEEPFEMNLEAGEYLNRFSLTFKLNNAEEIIEEEGEVGGVEVVEPSYLTVVMDNNAGELQIRNTTNSEITEVKLFNSLGQLVGAWNQYLNKTYKALPVNIKATGVYVVQLQTSTGVITKKVLIE
ncbi:LamG-like jellyroll fold domain-containing protein [Lutibacter holmesii]|uniref:LamG-like jellyroll fold domain-containing protein n=1 Tax=Lutibacter holmesii TaxID=1137985 RepID=A0ABW3WK88_9FLAO